MKTRMTRRVFSLLLVLVMLVSIFPVPAFAAGEISSTTTNSNTDDGVSMKKTSVYDPDTGKMDITIEAYTTGHVVSSTRTVPTDIVLVLDVSGSMNSTRMTSMKNAVNNFIATTKTQNDSVANDADKHSIAIIKFADDSFYNANNPLAVGNHRNNSNYNYTEVIADFTTVNASGVTSLQTAVNALNSGGATAVDYGLDLATQLLDARKAADSGAYSERNKVIIVFADGEPNHQSGYDSDVAYNAVERAYTLKSGGTKIFTIGIFDGADHTDITSNANKFMNFLSSNYPLAYGSTTTETGYWGLIPYEYTAYHINAGAEPHYTTYYHDADTDSLNSVFQTIASSVGSPQIELGESATLVDVVSDYFNISYVGADPEIGVYTADYKGGADFNDAANWAAPVAATGVTAEVSGDGDTVTVSGFDYDTNYVSATARDGGIYGKKLILKISSTPNYAAIDAAAAAGTLTSANIPTNDSAALLDSTSVNAAWVANPALQANTVTYKVIVDGEETVTDTYYRFPGAEKELIDKPTDTNEHSYGDWETDDTHINDGSITMPSGDVEIVSVAEVKKYDITFEYSGSAPAGASALPGAMNDIPVGNSVTLPAITAPDGYTFSGWVEDGADAVGPTFNMPAEDLHFRGSFIAQARGYTVEHYLMNTDGTWPTTPNESVPYSANTDSLVTAQIATHHGLTYDEATTRSNLTAGITMASTSGNDAPQGTVKADGSLVLKLYYKRNQHTVTYAYDGTVPSGVSPTAAGLSAYTATYYTGQEVDIKADATAPGYSFSGWRIYTGATSINGGKMIMPDSDVVLHGSFTANSGTKYTVEHYFETTASTDPANKSNYAIDSTKTQTLFGVTDTTATAVPISSLVGFTYESGLSTSSGNIAGDGSLVLSLYYSRTRHTVKYQYRSDVPAGASALPATATYKYGDIVTVAPAATAQGYTFSGWGTTDASIADGQFSMPAKDVNIYGQFSPAANKYTVEIYEMNTDGTWPSVSDHTHTYEGVKTGETATATVSAITGFTYDEAKTTASGSQNAGVTFTTVGGVQVPQATVKADGTTVLKLYFNRNRFNVTYVYDNAAPAGAPAVPVDSNSYYFEQNVTIAAKPVVPGYTFHGWSLYTGAAAIEGNTMSMPNSNVTLHGSFTANSDTPYTVEHYFESTSSTDPTNKANYELDTDLIDVLTGVTGSTVTAEPYSGTIGVNYEAGMSTAEGIIKGDGSLVLRLYYSRQRNTVTYQYLNTVPGASALPEKVTYKYGDTVTVAPAATAQGYTFSGWSTTHATVADGKFSMPANEVVISGYFSPAANKYVVEHYLMNTDGTYPTSTEHVNEYPNVKTGDTVTATTSAYTGFTFHEGYAGNVLSGTVAADGSTVLKVYYKRNQFNVTYVYDNAAPAGAPAVPVDGNSYYYEQNVNIAAKPVVPGYTFHGWSLYTGATAIEGNTMTMPNSNVTLHGSFTANSSTPYTVEHYFESPSSTDHTNKANYAIDNSKTKTLSGTTDSTATAEIISDLIGFNYEPGLSTATGTIKGDGSLVLRLYYSRQRNTVTYQYLNTVPGASALPEKVTYKYGDTVTVAPAATALGYTFSGWSTTHATISEGQFSMPANEVVISGIFSPAANKYTVEVYEMNTDGSWPTTTDHKHTYDNVKTGDTVTATISTITGLTYDPDKTSASGSQNAGVTIVTNSAGQTVPQAVVAADGSTVLKLYFKRNQHTVTYEYLNTVTGASALPSEATYYYGQEVTIAGNATAPGYTFTGWSIRTGDTAIVGGKMVMPNSDVVLRGAFNAEGSTPYRVEHYFEDLSGNYVIDSGKTENLTGQTDTEAIAVPLSGDEITGFSFNATKSEGTRHGNISGDGSLVLKLYYDRTVHTVTYQYTGTVPGTAAPGYTLTGGAQIVNGYTATYKYGETVEVKPNASADGYDFSGWTPRVRLTINEGEFTMPAGDVTFTGHFTAKANRYKVEHYLMGLDGKYPTTTDDFYYVTNVVTDQSVSVDTNVLHPGFTYDEDAANVTSGIVAADGSTVLKLYFKRNQFTVTYLYDGTVPAGATTLPTTKTHYYQEEVTIASAASAPGYTFTGWTIHTGATAIVGGKMLMPNSNVIIHGAFNASLDTPYTVNHYFENVTSTDHGNAANYTLDSSKTQHFTGTTATDVVAEPLSGTDILGFDYYPALSTAEGTIAADGSLVLNLYYKRMDTVIKYQFTGSVPTGAVLPGNQNTTFGATATVAGAPAVNGYTFHGWFNELGIIYGADNKFTVPAVPEIIFSGRFTANPNQYKVEHYLMGLDGTYPATTDDFYYVTNVVTDQSVSANTNVLHPGFTYDEGAANVTTGVVKADGSTVLKLYFKRNQFTVSYQYDGTVPTGASTLPETKTYYYQQEVTIAPNATAPGYNFTGWAIHTGATSIVGGKMLMPNSNVIIHGAFTASNDTPYTVQHYFENVDSTNHEAKTNYTLDSSKTQHFTGTTATGVVAEPLSGSDILGFDYYPALSSAEGTIAADGSLVLKLYYKRMDTVIKYQFTGTVPAGAVLPPESHTTYGATAIAADTPFVQGYTFHGWFNELGITYGADNKFTVPAVPEIIFSGRFTTDLNKYKVEHYLMGLDGKYPTTTDDFYYVTNVVTGQHVTASTDVEHTGFTYDPTAANVLSANVAGDGSTVLKVYFRRDRYTVSYQYDGTVPAGASTLPASADYYYGQEVSVAPNATAIGYLFTGWAIHTGDTAITGGKMLMPNHNVIIHGAFNADPNTKYTIEHYFEVIDNTPGTIDFSAAADLTTTRTGKTGSEVIAMPLSGEETIGFTFDADISAATRTGTIKADGSLVLKLYYKRMESQVIYEYTGTVPAGAPAVPSAENHKYGTTVTVAANPIFDGYTFSGWKPWDTTAVSVSAGKFTMPQRTVYFHGSFSANPSGYTVNHFLMNADGSYPATPTSSELFSVDVHVSDVVTAVPITTYRTYTYDEAATRARLATGLTMANTAGIDAPSGTVTADGSLVLNLYYSRNLYDLSYEFTGEVPSGAVKPSGMVDIIHGTVLTLADAVIPAGYNFDGWYHGSTKVGNSLTMPAADTVVTGSFSARNDVKYTVEYYLEKLDGTYELDHSNEFTGTTGSYVVGARVDFTGFTFNMAKSSWNGHVKGDGSLILKLYYDRNTHTVSYYYHGEDPAGIVLPAAKEYKYGDTFTVEPGLTAVAPDVFRGWYTPSISGVSSSTENAEGTVMTMPNHDVVFYGAMFSYSVSYDLAGGTLNGADTIAPRKVAWDEAGLIPAGTPEKDGHDFTGWTYGNKTVTSADKYSELALNYTVINITLVANYRESSPATPPTPPAPPASTTGTAKLSKVDAADPSTVLADVVFELYTKSGALVGTYTTNAKGEITVPDLEKGEYYWLEVLPAEGYSVDSTHHAFTVSADKTTEISVTNKRTPVPQVFTGDHYGYIVGYEDGMVHPERNISRAEVATIFFRLLDDSVREANSTRENSFSDVNDGHWFNHAVSTMSAMGIINGYEDGTFRPNAPITRAEFAAIAARFDLDGDASNTIFKDIYEHWGRREINIAANNGWVLGYEDGTFKPDSLVTRAEAMAMVNRVLQRIPESSADLLPGMVEWPDNQDTRKWYYMAVQEATNSHYYTRKGSGYEKWTSLREVRNWEELEN